MRGTETWVQQYDPPIEPGPDGAPVNVADVFRIPYLGLHFKTVQPYVERNTTTEVRGGRLTRRWRRYLTKDWERWA